MNKPSFIMMVGLPGSGKSTYAKTLTLNGKPYIIHSSDNLREELYGDAAIQGDNNKLFAELHKRIKKDLQQRPNDFWLLIAALIHDIGKLDTKTRFNSRGVMDGECHYYNHNCAGAYKAMFYLSNIEKIWGKPCLMSYVTNLIYYHMHPYLAWKQSEKAKKRDKRLLGNELFNDIMLLHKADLAAH